MPAATVKTREPPDNLLAIIVIRRLIMNETQSLAPAGLPWQQRQHFDRILNKLIEREVCSVCSRTYPNNSRLAYGLDHVGEIVVVGGNPASQRRVLVIPRPSPAAGQELGSRSTRRLRGLRGCRQAT
jgi:hypothetical protein